MSKLLWHIKRSLDNIEGKPGTLKKIYYVLGDLWYNYPHLWIYRTRTIYRNFKFFWPHIINYRNWDSHYTITLLCDSLDDLAKGIKDGCHVNAEKCYRRCKTAAGMLRNAYDDVGFLKDKSYMYLWKKNRPKFEKLDNGYSVLTREYGNTEEYYNKMYKLISDRLTKVEKERKKEAWEYLHKYVEQFWD